MVQGSVSLGAWFGGVVVADLGIADVMAASGIIALLAALLVPFFGSSSPRSGG
jgi:predicted MFS family arabinose efflux permease